MTKRCNDCQLDLDVALFAKRAASPDGLQHKCRACQSLLYRRWQRKHIDQEVARVRRWKQANRPKKKLADLVTRARKHNAEIREVSEREIRRLLDSPCSACGTKGEAHIDHIIPLSRGGRHAVGNLQALCRDCNSSKGKRTMTEWKVAQVRESRPYERQPRKKPAPACVVDGCADLYFSLGFCRFHYYRNRRNPELLAAPRRPYRKAADVKAERVSVMERLEEIAKRRDAALTAARRPLPPHLEAQAEAIVAARRTARAVHDS